MSITPPVDGNVTYGAPLTVRWDIPGQNVSGPLVLPQELVDALSDDDLEGIAQIIDQAMGAQYQGLEVYRTTLWTPQAQPSSTMIVVQEGSGGD